MKRKNIYLHIVDATGSQAAALHCKDVILLLLRPLDDEDRALAVLRAVVADAAQERPLDEAVSMAAHDEQVGAHLVGGVADDVPRVPALHQRLDRQVRVLGADALCLVDGRRRDGGGVPLNARQHVRGHDVPCAVHGGVDGARAARVHEDERVAARRGDDVGEAPGERVHALLALVHGHHDAAPGSGGGGGGGSGGCHAGELSTRIAGRIVVGGERSGSHKNWMLLSMTMTMRRG